MSLSIYPWMFIATLILAGLIGFWAALLPVSFILIEITLGMIRWWNRFKYEKAPF